MIQNKMINIKIIFKTYLKILKIGLKYFKFSNRFLLYKILKIVFKNYFKKLFFKIVFKNNYQTCPIVLN